jgi:hypothetical protein
MKQRSPIVSEFETDEQAAAYEQWLHEKVAKSLSDPRPSIAHDEALGRARAIIKAKGSRGEAC